MKFTKTIFKLINIPKLFDKEHDLTSNVAVNKILSPLYFIIIFYVFKLFHVQTIGSRHWYFGAFGLTLVSTFFYVWCSYNFQPDLDSRRNRPAMNTFPLGATILNSPLGFILSPIQVPLNKIWYYFWQPYASCCTHRGMSHWPIVSTWYRVGYILLWVVFIRNLFWQFGVDHLPIISAMEYWCKSFFPFQQGFGSVTWFCFCFPVYICDIAHEVVDAWDSKRKGISYCPPQIPRGLFIKSYEFVKEYTQKSSH